MTVERLTKENRPRPLVGFLVTCLLVPIIIATGIVKKWKWYAIILALLLPTFLALILVAIVMDVDSCVKRGNCFIERHFLRAIIIDERSDWFGLGRYTQAKKIVERREALAQKRPRASTSP